MKFPQIFLGIYVTSFIICIVIFRHLNSCDLCCKHFVKHTTEDCFFVSVLPIANTILVSLILPGEIIIHASNSNIVEYLYNSK